MNCKAQNFYFNRITRSLFIFKIKNNNLFKSIENGIITFKYDLTEYIDNLIGDLLYITDFLSNNNNDLSCVLIIIKNLFIKKNFLFIRYKGINKNEILINAIEEKSRIEVKEKLKNFRNIILSIIDILIYDINKDY